MKKTLALLTVALSAALSLPVQAATPVPDGAKVQALRDGVRADRKAQVLKALALDEAQAQRFAPLYARYEAELSVLHAKTSRLVVERVGMGEKLSGAQAQYFAKEYLARADDVVKLQRKYHARMVKALGEAGAAHFLLVERRIQALEAYDLWLQ